MSGSANLLTAPIAPTLKKMTTQVLVGMITLMSFNLIDTFFIGLLGTEPLAAISFTFPVTFTIISLAIGLGIGTSAVIAKARGADKLEEARDDGLGALILSFIMVAILAIATYYATDFIFTALGAKADMLPLIHDYMDIWYLGAVFLISPMVGNAVLRAAGDAKTPSIIMASSGLINAILDPLLIFGIGPFPELGIKGAAIASVIAWMAAFCVVIYVLAVKKKIQRFTTHSPTTKRQALFSRLMLKKVRAQFIKNLAPILILTITTQSKFSIPQKTVRKYL